MRRKCYLPKSYEKLKGLSPKELRFYWNTFYTRPLRGAKAKLRPLWYAIQCELGRCKLQEKYRTENPFCIFWLLVLDLNQRPIG